MNDATTAKMRQALVEVRQGGVWIDSHGRGRAGTSTIDRRTMLALERRGLVEIDATGMAKVPGRG